MSREVRSARLAKLKSKLAIPGYVLIGWQVVEVVSTLDFLTELPGRVANSPFGRWLITQNVSTWLAVIGILYLIVLVQWPSKKAAEPNSDPTSVSLPEPASVRTVSYGSPKPWIQSEAKTLAGEIARFVEAHRKEPTTVSGQMRLRSGALRTSDAIEAYGLQYADRVEKLYREALWTSAFKADGKVTLLGLLAAGPPTSPTTMNEIAGIGREIEALAASYMKS